MNRHLLIGVLCVMTAASALALASGGGPDFQKLLDEFSAAWTRHDTAAMAAMWAKDGDLINPQGVWARGRSEVARFLAVEHAGKMKGTSYRGTVTSTRFLSEDLALIDWAAVVTGIRAPDGCELPPLRHHVSAVFTKELGRWRVASGRPVAYAGLDDVTPFAAAAASSSEGHGHGHGHPKDAGHTAGHSGKEAPDDDEDKD